MESINEASDGASISSNSSDGGTWLNEDNMDEILGCMGETAKLEKGMKV